MYVVLLGRGTHIVNKNGEHQIVDACSDGTKYNFLFGEVPLMGA